MIALSIGGVALALAAEPAVRIQAADLPGILWSTAGACPDAPELAVRQCRGVRAARAKALAGKLFVVAGDDVALERDAAGFTVRGCVDCSGPAAIVTRGGVTVSQGRIVGPVVAVGPFALPATARVDLFVRLDGAASWTQEGHAGLAVDLVGYRLYDACSDKVYAVTDGAPSVTSRPAADCPAEPARAATAVPLPAEPTAADIKTAMDAVAPDVERCFDRYGVPGTADVFVEIGAGGEVIYAEIRGAFSDSPTGACVTSAVVKARFPRYARSPVRIHYPFLLR